MTARAIASGTDHTVVVSADGYEARGGPSREQQSREQQSSQQQSSQGQSRQGQSRQGQSCHQQQATEQWRGPHNNLFPHTDPRVASHEPRAAVRQVYAWGCNESGQTMHEEEWPTEKADKKKFTAPGAPRSLQLPAPPGMSLYERHARAATRRRPSPSETRHRRTRRWLAL